MKKVIEKRKDIVFYMKLFPLPMHKQAHGEAMSIACSKDPLATLDRAYERKPLPKATCKTTVVDDDIKLGKKLGVHGTPALIFPNGDLVSGAVDADTLIKMVDKKYKK